MIDTKIKDVFFWPDCFPEKNKTVFMDIETTGLSVNNSCIYMIGLAVHDGNDWHILQLFSRRMTEEQEILRQASDILNSAEAVITFNGNTFDIPFVQNSLKQYYLPELKVNQSLDLYKILKPLKALLGMERVKQCCFEERLGIDRKNDKTGEELIRVYEDYLKSPSKAAEDELFYHNFCDMAGMLKLCEIFAIKNMIETAAPTDISLSEDLLRLKLKSDHSLSFEVDYSEEFSLHIKGDTIFFTAPVVDGKTKLFYSNYKDYYYLPLEDRAIHKSLGCFVEAAYRKNATRDNCYSYESLQAVTSQIGLPRYLKSVAERVFKIYTL